MKIKIDNKEFDLNSEEIYMIKRIFRFYVHTESVLLTESDRKTTKSLIEKELVWIVRYAYYDLTSIGKKVCKRLLGKRI